MTLPLGGIVSRGIGLMCVATLTIGCGLNPFLLGVEDNDGGGSGGDGGAVTHDGATGTDGGASADATAPQDACIPLPEACDDVDNDCDGNVDEGFDLDQDPANCGGCGNACSLPGTAGACVAGRCDYSCLPVFHDLNGDLNMPGSNGCEYGPCTEEGAEVCDLRDNDCDDVIDEDIAGLDSDPDNCGRCFQQCIAVNVDESTCTNGVCGYGSCLENFKDIQDPPAGCEYQCPVIPPLAQEVCNGIDDDCDGQVDELPIDMLGQPCGPADPGDTGICSRGTMVCDLGVPKCEGIVGPEPQEVCDDLDHDCDGDPRNGFDIMSDPNNCGLSCTKCELPNAVSSCTAGQCTVQQCLPGFENANPSHADGCEYECTKTGDEICDGQDNDCDRNVDEGLTPPAGFACNGTAPCDGPVPQCTECNGVTAWRCVYTAAGVETDSCGQLVFQEARCDSVDGDCDGNVDEAYLPQLGSACTDNGIGICQGTGAFICDPGDDQQLVCDITDPGEAPMASELCNNLDDNCDGVIDNGSLVDDMTLVAGGTLSDGITVVADFMMDTYEASRADATVSEPGAADHVACSNPGVMPWRTVTRPEAAAMCLAAGKRLCTEAEWQRACEGAAFTAYPYGAAYDANACNGYDFDIDCTLPNDNEQVHSTGADYGCPAVADSCVSAAGIYDLSGNVQEWTSTQVSTDSYRVRGGSFQTQPVGLSCQHAFIAFDDTIAFPNLGFRCCQDAP